MRHILRFSLFASLGGALGAGGIMWYMWQFWVVMLIVGVLYVFANELS